MSKVHNTALMSAISLGAADGVPTHIHLLPAGPLKTVDGRKYFVEDLNAVAKASFDGLDDKRLILDINHATDLAAPNGGEAPAVGWITSLEVRSDGVWGAVDWTERGSELVRDRAYRGVSPVVIYQPGGKVVRIARASLVNRPNLLGLTGLNAEESGMSLMERLAEILGLQPTATEDEIVAAVKKANSKDTELPALQSALSDIGVALGVAKDAKPEAILTAAKGAKGGVALPEEITALQSELATVTTQLNTLQGDRKREGAARFVDDEIKRGRAGLNAAVRDRYIALHMADAAGTEELIKALPVIGGDSQIVPPVKDGEIALNAAQKEACAILGISEVDFKKTLAEEAR